MFGYSLIKTTELDRLKKNDITLYQLHTYSYWFSGFPLVYDLLRKFAKGEVHSCSVSGIRYDFGRKQGLDDYGKPLSQDAK